MNRSPALLATKLSGLFEILAEKGISRDTFLGTINIDAPLFNCHTSKLSVTQVVALLEKA